MSVLDGDGKPVNGEAPAKPEQGPTVVLTFALDHSAMHVSGNCLGNIELVLDMLGRATRYFDMQYRIISAQKHNEQMAQEREGSELAKKLGFGR